MTWAMAGQISVVAVVAFLVAWIARGRWDRKRRRDQIYRGIMAGLDEPIVEMQVTDLEAL